MALLLGRIVGHCPGQWMLDVENQLDGAVFHSDLGVRVTILMAYIMGSLAHFLGILVLFGFVFLFFFSKVVFYGSHMNSDFQETNPHEAR